MPVLRSKLSDLDIPDNVGFVEYLFRGFEPHADKVALMHCETGEKITFGELKEAVDRLADSFHKRGVRKGDVVCLFAHKHIEGVVTTLAVLKLGAVITPCRPSHTGRELGIQVKDSGSKVVVADEDLFGTTLAELPNMPDVKKLFCVGKVSDYENIQDLMKTTETSSHPATAIDPKEDTAMLVYSSGTTGLPKGVIHTHYSLVAMTTAGSDPRIGMTVDVNFPSAPPYHMAGIVYMSCSLFTRNLMILYSPSSVVDFVQKAQECKAKQLIVPPPYLVLLSKMSDAELASLEVDFSGITFITGGSKFSALNTEEVISKIGCKAVLQHSGTTEFCGLTTMELAETAKPGSAGLLVANVSLKIADLQTGKSLGANETGEICVKGPSVMRKGYLNRPEATTEVFDSDGWLRLGDIGYYDETGHVFFIDRLKDVIKYQTMQVAPSEIEDVISSHPAVKLVCVVPVEDDAAGEVPLACVILKDRETATEQEIVILVKENLADYKRLRGGVIFMDDFPTTGFGKIARRQVRDIAKQILSSN